ncbi:hypothetical protein QWZ13_17695 [Reinekea marina]|uniref:hypothetical protein n=1 Tax=Reinekea marina TaxID=1310421 RepID=UPI0025B3C79C|nr:hypothetical protein [Reinekea marina]MDN3650744.1 hypothetical protein [Reinekea marina]
MTSSIRKALLANQQDCSTQKVEHYASIIQILNTPAVVFDYSQIIVYSNSQ